MSTTQEQLLLEANKAYPSMFSAKDLDMAPSRKVTIVTCMDGRLDPLRAWGFKPGEANVIRNAGAQTRDGARSILLSNHLLGTEEVFVVKHTHCGMLAATTELAHQVMKKNLGLTESKEVDDFEVKPIADLEQSAREDVEYLRNHPLALGKVRVTGWIHDLDTGLIKKVVE